jgi:Rieske Fe-S protein
MDSHIPGARPPAPAFDPVTTPLPRRRMLVLMGASALAAGGGLGMILEACATPAVTVKLEVDPATIQHGTPVEVPFTLTAANGSSVAGSAWLLRQANGTIVAYDPRCTHAGCRYAWSTDADRFRCNCHGGEFALDGTVLAGPPQRPLAKLPVTTSGVVLSVDVPGDFTTPKESLGA